MGLLHFLRSFCICTLLMVYTCIAGNQYISQIHPGFEGAQMNWIENDGIFLLSNKSVFGMGFYPALEAKSYVLVILHMESYRAVWTANRGLLVSNSDKFIFENDGNVYMKSGHDFVFETNTKGLGVTSMELQDNGNLVLFSQNREIIWQSFSHPSDTLLPGQEFLEGMRLKSFPNYHNMSHFLEINSGDVILYAGFHNPQIYWSMSNESRKIVNNISGDVYSASVVSNSWNFYDKDRNLHSKFIFSDNSESNATWTIFLGTDGAISFYNLDKGRSVVPELIKIPQNSCNLPEPCDPYNVCSFDNRCQCPSALGFLSNCRPQPISSCNISNDSVKLLHVGEKLDYFALNFVTPITKSDLVGCQEACIKNCSCSVLFFEGISGNCFLFDEIGSLQRSDYNSSGFTSYVKVSSIDNAGVNIKDNKVESGNQHVLFIVIIGLVTSFVIIGLLSLGLWHYNKKRNLSELYQDNSEEDTFLDSISGMPVRFSYSDLQIATNNFSVKLGQGGFGSVYQGVLSDGTRLAVKKLEGIGQGKKEFRAEVSIIGSIHHVHLVRLKGFCAEGVHRLLVYEYMAKGSLDKWIFNNNNEEFVLDWQTRFHIAIGMAKGLAYLHEECDVKIVHCDIKPENVLLDDKYHAKVSDFGLAKLMNREQSHVFTTLRGTRGYLAPEWLTNYAISERSDVFSYGMVLLEIISGRKNFEPEESSTIAHFPSYAFKMVEEGKSKEIIDSKLIIDESDESVIIAIKVALWCIQDDVYLRPPMTKVAQMLEGLCTVPQPPTSTQMRSRLYSGFLKWSNEDGTLSGSLDYNSDALLSATRLSGPR